MKKLLTVVLLLFTAVTLQAQTDQGSIILGGGLGITSEKSEQGDDDDSEALVSYFINPRIGYFLADNFALGLQVGYDSEKVLGDLNDLEGRYNTWVVGPFARYYIPTANDNFAFYLQGSFLYGQSKFNPKDDDIDDDTLEKITLINGAISPGFTFFASPKVGIDFQLTGIDFTRSSQGEGNNKATNTSFTLGLDSFTPSVGIHLYF